MNEEVKILIESITSNDNYNKMKNYIAHGNISCYEHCYNVAIACYSFVLKYNIKCNMEDLIIGSLLHDYYLYDWHEKDNGISLHGYKHHKYAMKNAIRDFNINKRQQKIIYSHMFPLTFWTIPIYKEAWIVNLFDKVLAVKEINKLNYIINKIPSTIYNIMFILIGIK